MPAGGCYNPGMSDSPERPAGSPSGSRRPSSESTLFHVRAAQKDGDGDVAWANLHEKMQVVVREALQGQNLPPDRSLDDLAQDVMLQVFADVHEFDAEEEGASFRGWVATIAQRKLTDAWRRARAKKRGGGRERHLGEFDEIGGRDRMADERTPRQSMFANLSELNDALSQALAALGDKHKRVIELHMFQGRPFKEIAHELGYTKEVSVRSLYLRAREQLQELLAGFRP
jgi:RNA polymerase sigma factor (sigma-70 family)